MNPYEELGVPKDADDATIDRAFRSRAKKAHPDHGGSREEFAVVSLARETLKDRKRRERYDRTGKVEEDAADNTLQTALSFVLGAIDGVLARIPQGRSPESYNVLGDAKTFVELQRQQVRDKKREVERKMRADEKLAKKFKPKKGKPDRIGPMFAARAAQMQQQVDGCERDIVMLDLALDILAQHEFEHDPGLSPAPDMANPFMNLAGWR